MRFSKYHSKKVVVDGILFDSTKEGKRYSYLKDLENKGEIKNLRTQVEYELIPSQKLDVPRMSKRVQRVEKPVKYIADFVYEWNGKTMVEDTKGMKTPEYIIKRKLLKYIFGIEIIEV